MKLTPVGSNQTELELPSGITVLFSYSTPVAAHVPGEGFYKTNKNWSRTTSNHVTLFLKRHGGTRFGEKSQEWFDALKNPIKRNPTDSNERRIKLEERIARHLIRTLSAAGWKPAHVSGVGPVRSEQGMMDALFALSDGGTLTFEKNGQRAGVLMVNGNGIDILTDYTAKPGFQEYVAKVEDYVNELQAKENPVRRAKKNPIGGMRKGEWISGYPDSDTRGNLRDGHGNIIGSVVATGSRPAVFFGRRSFIGNRHISYRVTTPDGSVYYGRGFGNGMLLNAKKSQARSVRDNPDPIPVKTGDRVQISPSYDAWMRGDRYGEVVKITKKSVIVKLDKSGKLLRIPHYQPTGIYEIIKGNPVKSAHQYHAGRNKKKRERAAIPPVQQAPQKSRQVFVQAQKGNDWLTVALVRDTPELRELAKRFAKTYKRKHPASVVRVITS